MLATITSASLLGVTAQPVTVEVHFASTALPGLTVVGTADSACRELRDRVRSAILSSGLVWPTGRITINIAPRPSRPTSTLDLPIALGILAASGQLDSADVDGWAAVGELGLDGSLRPVRGLFPLSEALRTQHLIVPACPEAQILHATHDGAIQAGSLSDALDVVSRKLFPSGPGLDSSQSPPRDDDIQVDHGRLRDAPPEVAVVLEIAAAGGHHLLCFGSAGAANTWIADGVASLLPDLSLDQAAETVRAHSAAGFSTLDRTRNARLVTRPPTIRPHPAGPLVSIVGGAGSAMAPGAMALAHNGVLALDDLAEYPAAVLDCLAQPVDEGIVRVARAHSAVTYPARFILAATANRCSCANPECRCSPAARSRYVRRVADTVIDRFHLRIDIDNPPAFRDPIAGISNGWKASGARTRVATARSRARRRGVTTNADLTDTEIANQAPLTDDAHNALTAAVAGGELSQRGQRIVRAVALTIADLGGHDGPLTKAHIDTAMALRTSPFTSPTPDVARQVS